MHWHLKTLYKLRCLGFFALLSLKRDAVGITVSSVTKNLQREFSYLKLSSNNFSEFIYYIKHEGISMTRFPNILKKGRSFLRKRLELIKNYRPSSLLHLISKILKRLIFKQLITFFERLFSTSVQISEGHSAQHCLLMMTEKWKRGLDMNGVCEGSN